MDNEILFGGARIPERKANEMVNRNEDWIKAEVYGLYRYLKSQQSMWRAPHRFKDILRGSLNGTAWGYFVTGLVSVEAAKQIDLRMADPQSPARESIQRDHIFPWYETAVHFADTPLLDREEFWTEMKRRSQVCFVLKSEHVLINGFQRKKNGLASYRLAGVDVLRLPEEAFEAAGFKGRHVSAHWPSPGSKHKRVDLVKEFGRVPT